MAEGIPRDSFYSVPVHGTRRCLASDRKTNPRGWVVRHPEQDSKVPVGDAVRTGKHPLEVTRCQQSRRAREGQRSVAHPVGRSGSQPGTALGTTSLNHLPAILGGHAGAETVGPLALDNAGLIGALHDSVPFSGGIPNEWIRRKSSRRMYRRHQPVSTTAALQTLIPRAIPRPGPATVFRL